MTRPAIRTKKTTTYLSWDALHLDSRREICSGAAINEKVALLPWLQVDEWLRPLLSDSLAPRTKGMVGL